MYVIIYVLHNIRNCLILRESVERTQTTTRDEQRPKRTITYWPKSWDFPWNVPEYLVQLLTIIGCKGMQLTLLPPPPPTLHAVLHTVRPFVMGLPDNSLTVRFPWNLLHLPLIRFSTYSIHAFKSRGLSSETAFTLFIQPVEFTSIK